MKQKKRQNITISTPEMQVLLLTCLSDFSQYKQEQVQKLVKDHFDWGLLYHLASKHRVFPFVYHNLSSLESILIPTDILKKFESLCRASLFTAMHMAGELSRIFLIFHKSQLSVLALKGPSLAIYLYGELGMRSSSGDLDLLVELSDLERAEQLLEEAGYTKEYHGVTLTEKQNEMQLRHNHHHIFTHPNHVTVELHWKLHKNIPLLSFSELWESRKTLEISGVTVFMPGPEEYLQYLMFHGSRHGFSQLKWLCDIAELLKLEKGTLDWQRLESIAQEYHLLQSFGQTLSLIDKLFQNQGTKDALARILSVDPLGEELAKMVFPFIFSLGNESTLTKVQRSLHYINYLWKWYGTGAGKWRYQTSLFHPTMNELTTVRLSDRLYPLYYILRPLLLLQRALRRDKHHAQ